MLLMIGRCDIVKKKHPLIIIGSVFSIINSLLYVAFAKFNWMNNCYYNEGLGAISCNFGNYYPYGPWGFNYYNFCFYSLTFLLVVSLLLCIFLSIYCIKKKIKSSLVIISDIIVFLSIIIFIFTFEILLGIEKHWMIY